MVDTMGKPVLSKPQRQVQKKRKLGKSPKPTSFHGVGFWEDYKAQCNHIADTNGWEDETKVVYLEAFQVLRVTRRPY